MVASPPEGLIAQNDHAALTAWYDKEAGHLRQHAKDIVVMEGEYRKNPDSSARGLVPPKIDRLQHCEALVGMYMKAAEEADLLAKGHCDMLK